MEWFFSKEIKTILNINAIAKKAYIDIDDDESMEEIRSLVAEAENIAVPKVVIAQLNVCIKSKDEVKLNEQVYNSRLLAANLSNCNVAYGVVATCGTEIDKWAKKYKDPLLGYIADVIMLEVLGCAVTYINNYLSSILEGSVSHISPGSTEDFPIQNQEKLFKSITGVSNTQITLTSDYLMLPLKSVSGIYFSNGTDYADCEICTRVNCPTRRKPYDDDMYRNMLS